MRIDAALWRFWLGRGAAPEVRDLLRFAVTSGRGEPMLRAKALNAAGVLADAALARYAEAAQIWQELGDAWGESAMCQNRAIVLELLNRYDEALPLLERTNWRAKQATRCTSPRPSSTSPSCCSYPA
ncbi:MAG: hypothetical protein ACXVFQ_03360 [Solirubrobacteraceae bacterium]